MGVVRVPKWTGADDEYAVVISRGGDVPRGDGEMQDAIGEQVEEYLTRFVDPVPAPALRGQAATRIGRDHIRPGAGITISRAHLLAYVDVAARAQETAR